MAQGYQKAKEPEDLSRFFAERAKADDLEGLVALYEPGAVMAGPRGEPAAGHAAIRKLLEHLLASGRNFGDNEVRPAIRAGDIALTSVVIGHPTGDAEGADPIPAQVTAEVARQQPDGSWLWVVDQPRVLPT